MKTDSEMKQDEIEEIKRLITVYFELFGQGDYPYFTEETIDDAISPKDYLNFRQAWKDLVKDGFTEHRVLVRNY